MKLLELLLQIIKNMFQEQPKEIPIIEDVINPVEPIEVKEELKWDKTNARHSCRVVMDEYGLSWKEKNLLCAVLQAESGFNINAVNHNINGTIDHGIAQINSRFWIGKGKYFESAYEIYNDPAKSVRFMVEQYKAGHLSYWCAYTNKSYIKFL